MSISFQYDDKNSGIIPEDLDVAYQNAEGFWMVFNSVTRDQATKTLTASTTHFTDYTTVYPWKLVPTKARVRVGKSIGLALYYCGRRRSAIDKFFSLSEECLPDEGYHNVYSWTVNGIPDGNDTWGWTQEYNEQAVSGGTYKAPAKKPNPNLVIVRGDVAFKFNFYARNHPTSWVVADIEIVDGGYRVSGNIGPSNTVVSGVICDLEKPFTIQNNNPFNAPYEFIPTSPTTGTWRVTETNGITGGGGGKYMIEGSDTEKTGIVLDFSGTATIVGRTSSVSGVTFHINLTPLEWNGCGGQ